MPFLSFRTKQSFDRRTSGGRLCRKDRSKEHCSRSELSELLFAKSFLKGFVHGHGRTQVGDVAKVRVSWARHPSVPACTFAFKQSQLWAQCGRQGISDRHRQTPQPSQPDLKRLKDETNREQGSAEQEMTGRSSVPRRKGMNRDEHLLRTRGHKSAVFLREKGRLLLVRNQQGLQMAKRVRK